MGSWRRSWPRSTLTSIGRIYPPTGRQACGPRILTSRNVMLRHRWAPGVIETRTSMSPEFLGYYDAVVGHFLAGGFSTDLAHHALHALGSRSIGFTQELFEPDDQAPGEEDMEMMELMAQQLPNLSAMLAGRQPRLRRLNHWMVRRSDRVRVLPRLDPRRPRATQPIIDRLVWPRLVGSVNG